MSAFEQAFAIVVGEEGGFTSNAADPGNWTGGACGQGSCRGTKFGISAAAYPALDIGALTLDAARAIYRRDYWDKVAGDALPPPLALLMFDAAVNNGVARAARWLQAALGVEADGAIGPATLAAVNARSGDGAALLAEVLAQRLAFMAALPTWRSFGLGWSRRLCALPFHAVQMAGVPATGPGAGP
jgi:lysozyme family protein